MVPVTIAPGLGRHQHSRATSVAKRVNMIIAECPCLDLDEWQGSLSRDYVLGHLNLTTSAESLASETAFSTYSRFRRHFSSRGRSRPSRVYYYGFHNSSQGEHLAYATGTSRQTGIRTGETRSLVWYHLNRPILGVLDTHSISQRRHTSLTRPFF